MLKEPFLTINPNPVTSTSLSNHIPTECSESHSWPSIPIPLLRLRSVTTYPRNARQSHSWHHPNPVRNQHKTFRTNIPCPESREWQTLWSCKERWGVWGEEKLRFESSWFSSPHIVYQLFKAELLPKSWEYYFLISLFNAERFSGATFDKEAAALFSFCIAS